MSHGQAYPAPATSPARRRPALPVVVGAVVAVVLFGVGLTVGLLTLDGGSSPPPAPTTDSTGASPLSGDRLVGTGYSYPLPEDWNDVTDEVKADDPSLASIDTVVTWGRTLTTGRANLIVEATSSLGSTDPESQRAEWQRTLETSVDAKGTPIEAPTIDAEDAIGLELARENESGVAIVQTAYLTIHDGTTYTLTYTITDGDDDAQAVLGDLVTGWSWED